MITILLEKIKALLLELKTNIEHLPTGGGDDDYSTDEKKIGKWIDGRDLYKKTIVANFDSNTRIDLTIPNATSIIDIYGSWFASDSTSNGFIGLDNDGGIYIYNVMSNGSTYITMRILKKNASSWGTQTKVCITVKYTKDPAPTEEV